MTTPAVWAVLAALWLGCLRPSGWAVALLGAGLLALAAAVRRHPPARLLLVAIAVVAVGSGLAGARVQLLASGPLAGLAREGGAADIVATVVSDPRPTDHGAWQLLRVISVDGRRSGQRALLQLAEVEGAAPFGAQMVLRGTARPLGHDGFDAHLRRLHVGARVDPTVAPRVTRTPSVVLQSANNVRQRTRAAAQRFLSPDAAALLSGLVTGDTAGLTPPTSEAMLAAGLTHLVAVSGSNVALVLTGTVSLAAAVGVGARGRRRAAIAALLWFTVLVRAEPSVLRAAVMAAVVLVAQGSGRGHSARHTLAVAATLLLLIDPMLSGQLGFILSVLATAGVLVAGPAIARRVPGPRTVATLVGATAGAQTGVAPVLLTVEGGLPLGALPANLVAVPAAAFASAIGVLVAVTAQVSASAGAALAVLAAPALNVILWAGRTFANGPSLEPRHLLSPLMGLLLAAVLLRRRIPILAPAVVVLVAFTATGNPWSRAADVAAPTLTALDVGQGDALLVEVPAARGGRSARMLVDGGPEPNTAIRLLRQRGVRHLDAVVVSHPHADHTDGLPGVLSGLTVSVLITGPAAPDELDDPAVSAAASEAVAAQRGVPLVRVGAGQAFALGTAVVEVLSPPADGSLGREPNDNSLVLRIRTASGTILLTGDAEEAAQLRLLRRPDLITADVLKVPHHGGNTNAEGFLQAVGASTAVIGVGTDNTFGHPHPDVLAQLAGARVVRTDTDATTSVELTGPGSAALSTSGFAAVAPPSASAQMPACPVIGATSRPSSPPLASATRTCAPCC